MTATLRAKFDGNQFLLETRPPLEPVRTYILHVEEVDSESRAGKIAALRDAVRDEAFLRDLRDVAADFAEIDTED